MSIEAPAPTTATRTTRPPRSLNVVRGPHAIALAAEVDWSAWYLTDEEDMGEGCEQGEAIRILLASLRELARLRGWRASELYVGADNFFAWVEDHPLVRVSPDVYLLRDPPPAPLPGCWETWRPGHRAPWVAFEIASTDWRKDDELGPEKYAQLGVEELWIFDPHAVGKPDAVRVPLQGFRRSADGAFVACHAGGSPASSRALGCSLVVAPERPAPRLRLSLDGEALLPTTDEAREAAEREIERLRAELARFRSGGARG